MTKKKKMKQKYQLNRKEIEKFGRDRYRKIIVYSLITFLIILTVSALLMMFYRFESNRILTVIGYLLGFFLLPMFLVLWVSAYLTSVKNLMYAIDEIEINEDGLMIDGKTYLYDQIKKVKITPPSYQRPHRMMVITDSSNKVICCFLGFGNHLMKSCYDYDGLCRELKNAFKRTPDKMIYDL